MLELGQKQRSFPRNGEVSRGASFPRCCTYALETGDGKGKTMESCDDNMVEKYEMLTAFS